MKGKKKAAGRSAYWRKYYAENLERERARKRQWYLDNRDDTIERVKSNQRKSDPIGPVYRVGIKRRYLVAGGRAYFNSRLGFSASELRAIVREMGSVK